jgi:ComF family protein
MAAEAKDSSARGGHTVAAPLSKVVPVFETEGKQRDDIENLRARGRGGRFVDFAVLARRAALWMADAVAGVVFPGECRICGGLLATASRVPLCEACLAAFEPLGPRICTVCGSPLEWHEWPEAAGRLMREGERVCRACAERRYGFDRARSFAHYRRGLAQAILLMKFERIDPLAEWFAARLAELARREHFAEGVDVVVPVPLHRERQRERGFNQADLIARGVARRLRLPYRPVLLVRTKPRPNKYVLSLEERWASVRGAFATRAGSQVDKQSVLLVDDVMTTGATLDACARALHDAGAKRVIGLTVARAVRDALPSSGEQ